MVQAMVKNHFLEKKSRSSDTHKNFEFDLVRGKGRGLVVLLHGAPGVGKTSTAECVAESNGMPLFPITCGDLGLTAESVETELSEKFHLAQLWDCILLLDEADVFLAQRTRDNIKRNSLVSVFLRVLEYYTGILFLTTNRVGAFDEAFKSRIHLPLYFPPLGERQTLSIWSMNLERTLQRKKESLTVDKDEIMDFAMRHYKSSREKKANWNGRQIRNAFQTASALAEYDAWEENSRRQKDRTTADQAPISARLEKRHFETVATASLQFDEYMTETMGYNSVERAHHAQERTDHFKPNFMYRREQQQQQQQPRPPQPGHGGLGRSDSYMMPEYQQMEYDRYEQNQPPSRYYRPPPQSMPPPPLPASGYGSRASAQLQHPYGMPEPAYPPYSMGGTDTGNWHQREAASQSSPGIKWARAEPPQQLQQNAMMGMSGNGADPDYYSDGD